MECQWLQDVSCVRTDGNTWRLTSQGLAKTATGHFLVHVAFGFQHVSDDLIYNPGNVKTALILLCSIDAAGTVVLQALRNEFPFSPVSVLPQTVFQAPKTERWDQQPLVCGGRETSILVVGNSVFWFAWSWNPKASEATYRVKETSCGFELNETALSVCLAREGVVVLGCGEGRVRVLFRDPESEAKDFKLPTGFPVTRVERVASNAVLVTVAESGTIRLWLLHTLLDEFVELQISFPVLASKVEPLLPIASVSPKAYQAASTNTVVVSSDIGAVYFLSLRSALELLELHAADTVMNAQTPPLHQASVSVLRMAIFDHPLRDFTFLRPGVLHALFVNNVLETVEFP